ncbi:META domain-containing protein [Gallaecimonas mangrovi]|uniref:META domain-containing protein n=1 Tax=Gallaecimonas mangrovi TaxID=2291597 RepID=UPI000E1FF060|nr:META domain-containing protein [Gallaecimonas mangrovi]
MLTLKMAGLAALALFVAACSTTPPPSQYHSTLPSTLTGQMTYKARIALPPQAYAVVDVIDASGQPLAEKAWPLDGKQVPQAFAISLPDGGQAPFKVQAQIFVNARPAWLTPWLTVTPMSNSIDMGEILLAPAPPGAFSMALSCAKHYVSVGFTPDSMQIHIDGKRYDMKQVEAASGARYQATTEPGTVLWNKGSKNWVTVKGQSLPDCKTVGTLSTRALTGKTWQVEDINGAGIIDSSLVSLSLNSEGRLVGKASCNNFYGSFSASGDNFEVQGLASTQKMCTPALMDQEQKFLQALTDARHFAFTNKGALILFGPGGGSIKAVLQKP